jgi:peroxiredoxin
MPGRTAPGYLPALLVLIAAVSAQAVRAGDLIAPGFAYEDINPNSESFGQSLALSDLYAERGLVLNFLASWCGYCWKELPELEKLGAADVAPILGVAADEYDGPAKLKKMIGQMKLSFPILLVPGAEIDSMGRSYRHRILPATYLIDNRGSIRRVFEGAVSESDLKREILQTLKPPTE